LCYKQGVLQFLTDNIKTEISFNIQQGLNKSAHENQSPPVQVQPKFVPVRSKRSSGYSGSTVSVASAENDNPYIAEDTVDFGFDSDVIEPASAESECDGDKGCVVEPESTERKYSFKFLHICSHGSTKFMFQIFFFIKLRWSWP